MNDARLNIWNAYYEELKPLADAGQIGLPVIPADCRHNAHMFYIMTKDIGERDRLIKHLRDAEIQAVFHYVPLHSSKAGLKYGRFHGKDRYTTNVSERLLRLPMYYGLEAKDVEYIAAAIKSFYGK